jgi:hypothetical protein
MILDVTPLQINTGSDANTACNSVTYPTPLKLTIVSGIATTLIFASAAIMTGVANVGIWTRTAGASSSVTAAPLDTRCEN